MSFSCQYFLTDLGTLPSGWEIAIDGNGDRYFIDHNTKTTTYNEPQAITDDIAPVLLIFPDRATTDDVLASSGLREVDIDGHVFIVTGGSSGIGLFCVILYILGGFLEISFYQKNNKPK